MPPPIPCIVTATDSAVTPIAQSLAQRWKLPYTAGITPSESGHDTALVCVKSQPQGEPASSYIVECSTGPGTRPVSVNFSSGKSAYRLRHGGGSNQAIARAIGIKAGFKPTVIDATAGLAQDAFVMAQLGCNVCMLERSAVIAMLIEDGIRRAKEDSRIGEWAAHRIHLVNQNSIEYLTHLAVGARPDTIYLDPMYPHRTKSALVKKEMRLLRRLVGDDSDSFELLRAALCTAKKRVVVKRPKGAEPLASEQAPSHCIETKKTRYDVYMIF